MYSTVLFLNSGAILLTIGLVMILLVTPLVIIAFYFLGRTTKDVSQSGQQAAKTDEKPKDKDNKKTDTKKSGLWTFLKWCIALLLIAAFGYWLKATNDPPEHKYPSYVKALPDIDQPLDHTDEMTDRLEPIRADANGFHGPISLPRHWSHFQVTHSRNPNDWFVVWCNGRIEPQVIHPYYDDGLKNDFNYCFGQGDVTTKFFLQGHGTISFRMTDRQP